MREDGLQATCCTRATEEEVESDPQAFDCETCELHTRKAALSDHDRLAIEVYNLLAGPAVQRLHLTPLVFDALGLQLSRADVFALIEKLDVIEQDQLEARAAARGTEVSDG